MSSRENVSILVPWRTDHGHRERVWDYLRPLWEALPYELCVGTDTGEGLFNCAMAINAAAFKATGDYYVIMGADHYPNVEAIDEAVRFARYGWMPVFGAMDYLSQVDTELVLAGEKEPLTCTPVARDPSAVGNTAVRADAFQEVGGMDERYRGWGWEDTAFLRTLTHHFGIVKPPFTVGLALWHPTGHRDLSASNPNRRLFESES